MASSLCHSRSSTEFTRLPGPPGREEQPTAAAALGHGPELFTWPLGAIQVVFALETDPGSRGPTGWGILAGTVLVPQGRGTELSHAQKALILDLFLFFPDDFIYLPRGRGPGI